MKISKEDIELFKLIDLASNGNKKAKWEIVWKFDSLIKSSSLVNGKFDEQRQYAVEPVE